MILPKRTSQSPSPAGSQASHHWADPELIEQLQAGSTQALALLYDRYAPIMLALALRVLGDEREAQDLVHDVFLEAWEKAREYDVRRGSVRTWFLIRTRSRALDRRSSARISRRSDAPAPAGQDPRGCVEPDGLAVRGALERLPVDARQALELSYFAGMTAGEIGKTLGVPEGTIRSRLARGLRLLEGLLSG